MQRHRTVALALLLAALPACSEKHYFSVDLAGNATPVDADGHPLSGAAPAAPMENPHGGAMDAPPAAGPLAGTIELDPALHLDLSHFKCVFVIAKRDPGKPADAVRRIAPVVFPMKFELSNGDAMHGSGLADGSYVITARLDADGDAMPGEGDVQGVSPVMRPGGAPATIVLGQLVTAEMAAAHPVAAMPGGAPAAGAAPFAPFAGGGMAERAPTPEDLGGPRFKGRVELGPEFAALDGKSTLYVIVRSATTGGAPLAPKRIDHAKFPVSFDIGTESVPLDVDNKAELLQGQLKVYARLSLSGNPIGQPGDIETKPFVGSAGGDPIVLVLDQRRTQ